MEIVISNLYDSDPKSSQQWHLCAGIAECRQFVREKLSNHVTNMWLEMVVLWAYRCQGHITQRAGYV